MAPEITGRTRPIKPKKQARTQKRKRDDLDAEKLDQAVSQLDPKTAYASFSDLPLSGPTVAGLKSAHYSTLTEIQAKAIPTALRGSDILGAAKTGSGKTLAFLIPVIENLYRAQCIGADAGLGAMIVSPTRELAVQIFEVLKNVGGKGHFFAAGLIIGGKSLREEQETLARMNIVVCTPGRILQHLSQTASFSVDNLRMLVLDEADRIMDMGFKKDVDAILEYLPVDRQTLLFSATQTKRVSDLSRLALKEPEYISVHEAASSATPQTLQQNYVLTPLPEKLDTLWSFLQASKTSKIIVFLSAGKQVKFVFESFRHMQPGIPLLHLHRRQKQNVRMETAQKFARAKHSCLFATDVAARGLDFPAVDWVIQVDCPEDADTYIHRVGRTARYGKSGRAVLFLDPNEEEGMLNRLEQKKVPIERINIRAKKQQSIKNQLQSMCFKDPALKYLGQKAFTAYVQSLNLQRDKEIFKIEKYSLEEFAASLGLPGAPRIKFLKTDEARQRKNAPRTALDTAMSDEGESEKETGIELDTGKSQKGVRTKYDRMFERQNQDVLGHYAKIIRIDDDDDVDMQATDGDLFDVKRRIPVEDVPETGSDITDAEDDIDKSEPRSIHIPGSKQPLILDSNRREKLLKSKKKLLRFKDKGSKLVFDDDGNAHEIYELEDENDFKARGPAAEQQKRFLDEEHKRVRTADVSDKALAREKRRAKKEKRKEREREETQKGDQAVQLNGSEDAMANFLADAQGFEESESAEHKEDVVAKRSKKSFASAGSTGIKPEAREIETFDDLEAEAARLLE